jgi:hypothetical protein
MDISKETKLQGGVQGELITIAVEWFDTYVGLDRHRGAARSQALRYCLHRF